jgi:hypothetical protein
MSNPLHLSTMVIEKPSFTCRHTGVMLWLMLGTATAWATTKGPDAGNYTGTDATVYSFVDVSTSGVGVLSGIDDGLAPLTMPFSFQFYGHAYTMVCASSNGALYFIASSSSCSGFNDFANTDLTVTGPPASLPAVLPFWSDLTFQVPGAGALFYQTLGTVVGSRKFVVQWNNAYPQGSSSPVTFQVILSEGSNNILFQYQTVALGTANPASNGKLATIGMLNAGGLSNGDLIQWSYDAGVVNNGSALLFSLPQASSCAANLSSQVTIKRGGFAYNAGTQLFVQTLTLTNSGTSAITAPIYVVLDSLSSNASLANGSGTTSCNPPTSPYIIALASGGSLAAGQSVTVQLQFANPSKAGITYTTRVLAGTGTP